jgi:Flp pilus assembly protein TadG
MRYRPHQPARHAAVVLEMALVMPLMFFLMLFLLVGGLGVFHNQQLSCQAREASRWASVHGQSWQKETKNAGSTQAEIRKKAVLPLATGMDPDKLTIKVEWVDQVTGEVHDWDGATQAVMGRTEAGAAVTHTVRVTVTYAWSPGFFLPRVMNLKSVSEVPMAF